MSHSPPESPCPTDTPFTVLTPFTTATNIFDSISNFSMADIKTSVESFEFTILMINDVYEIAPDHHGMGGLAEVTTLIKQEMEKVPNKNNVIVTLNGDFLSASSLAVKYKGEHMINILNATPIEYVVIGNHEFDFGAEVATEMANKSKFKWFGTNVLKTDSNDLMDGLIRKKIIQMGDFKVGLFGVCTPETVSLSRPGPAIRFTPVIETTKTIVDELRTKDKCDVIVALTHLSVPEDRELARCVSGIDVQLGGHDHTPHTQFQGSTFIHKAGHDSHWLTRIDLVVEKRTTLFAGKQIINTKIFPQWNMILNRHTKPDPEVKAIVDTYLAQLPQDSTEIIAFCQSKLDSSTESVRGKETTMGNVVADAMRSRFNTDLAMVNGGTIRGDRQYDEGTSLTKGDIYKEFPFPTIIQMGTITGEVLLEAVEQAISKAESKPGCFPHFSKGVSIEYDIKKDPMSRIQLATVNNKFIEKDKVYTIAITNYLFSGGDGLAALKKANHVPSDLEIKLDELMIDYLTKMQIVNVHKEGRIYVQKKKNKRHIRDKIKSISSAIKLAGLFKIPFSDVSQKNPAS